MSNSIIGVDLGGTNVRAGVVVGEQITAFSGMKISSKAEKEVVLGEVISVIRKVFNDKVSAIGIGVPSMVDVENGIVYDVQNIPSWDKINLKYELEKEFNVPVHINNDANCFAIGEKYFGKGKEHNNIVGLISGTGLGAGMVLNGSIYNGRNCGAGEFGMIAYKDSIFEDYCSGQFFEREYKLSGEELSYRAEEGDQEAIQIFNEYGKHLANAFKTILYAVDPDAIILGGSVSKSFKFYKDSLIENLNDFAFSEITNNLVIEVSEMENPAIYGAAALHLNYVNDKREK